MKKIGIVLMAAAFLGSPFAAVAGIQEVIQLPQHVFIPGGFDNNDQVEIILHGRFSGTCYQAGRTSVQVSGDNIVIRNTSYFNPDVPCLKMFIPWTSTVHVGALKAGNYHVYVQKSETAVGIVGELPVKMSISASIDDYLYAHVDSAQVSLDERSVPTITLSGTFGMSCMYIREVKLIQDTPDVVSVLPIVDFDRSKPCAVIAPFPYQTTVMMDHAVDAGGTLFHIRSLNGQSVNYVSDYGLQNNSLAKH